MANYLELGYYALRNLLFGVKFPVGISVDVTCRCNLNCKHCYFSRQHHTKELPGNELLSKIKETKRKYPSILHASWVGGEPLLRKDVVEEGIKLFPLNMVVTNGTMELPKWKNCAFNVSVDGTREYYEKIRGFGIYDKVKGHANRDDVSVNVVCVLNRQNYHCIEDMLKEWEKTRVNGVNFDFYTPIKGIRENLWLNWKERDKIILKLLELRKQYGDFLMNPEPVLEMMLSENSKKITEDCIVPKAVVCLDPMGKRKLPCVIGNKADCSRCGCVIPFFMESVLIRKHIRSFLITKKGFT